MQTFDFIKNAHWIYDLSLPLEDRSRQRIEFKTAMDAANWLGVPPTRVYYNRAKGLKIYSPRHQRWFAVRIAK